MEIDQRVKITRIEKCLSQRELAERTGISENLVSRIETNRVKPDQKIAEAIANVLGKPRYELGI